jgi:4-azaleucine resistance transporter AzlC
MSMALTICRVSEPASWLPSYQVKTVTHERVRDGARLALPLLAADFVDGATFGVIAAGIGLGVAGPILLSAVAFSGSAQFAALTVLGDHGGLLSILLAVAALNARYLVYGASVAPALSRNPARRALEAQLLTDASWALAVRDAGVSRGLMLGSGAMSWIGWTGGTAAGAVFGSAIGDYHGIGLDAAVPAFFACVLLDRVSGRPDVIAAVAAAALAVVVAPYLPPGVALIVVLAAALARPSR